MKTLKVTVNLEIRADADDDEAIKEAVKDLLLESIEQDELEYDVEESDEDDF